MFADATRIYERSLQSIESVRQPLLQAIGERKLAAGDFAEFPNPEATSGEAARQARAAFRSARKPTARNQSVIISGDSKSVRLVRVEANDDPALPALYEAIDVAKRDYFHSVSIFLTPRFR